MKKELRQKYLTIRNNIKNKEYLDCEIYKKVIDNPKIKASKLILIYVSFGSEIDTLKLIEYFLKEKLVAVPKVEDNIINFYYIKSLKELQKGKYNILEPISNNKVKDFNQCVSITPGICFSRDLYRIGYGKGYYDRFYNDHKKIYKIGLSYDECIVKNIENDKYDQKLNEIITPTNKIIYNY